MFYAHTLKTQTLIRTISSELHKKHLSSNLENTLLKIFNRIWSECKFLKLLWSTGIVIPILKPSKDELLPTSHRPISMTYILCKIVEKMIVFHLIHFLIQKL